MRKFLTVLSITIILSGCTDIFVNNAFAGLADDVSDMSSSELLTYLDSVDVTSLSDSELEDAEETLAESRVELTDDDLDNEELVEEYLDTTSALIEINLAQADVEGLITDAFSTDTEGEDSNFLDSLIEDEDRLADLEEASAYIVDAYNVGDAGIETLSTTELVLGSVGLVSDILQDETQSDALSGVADFETATLAAAGFDADEIEDIQLANEMFTLAEEDSSEDSPLASMFEEFPF